MGNQFVKFQTHKGNKYSQVDLQKLGLNQKHAGVILGNERFFVICCYNVKCWKTFQLTQHRGAESASRMERTSIFHIYF